jgi:hypothetical protein
MHATRIDDGRGSETERSTPIERTRQTTTGYLDALVGDGDIGRFLADNATFTVIGSDQVSRGREAVVGTIDWLHNQTFAGRPIVKTTFFGDDRAAIEADFIGTHVGEFAGIAATGRSVQVPYSVFYDLAGDEIAAIRVYMPMDVIRRQLGAG